MSADHPHTDPGDGRRVRGVREVDLAGDSLMQRCAGYQGSIAAPDTGKVGAVMSNPLHAEAFLILEATKYAAGGKKATAMKIAKVTQQYPLLNDTQVAVKVHVNINPIVFEQGLANIVIDVPDPDMAILAQVIEP